MRIWDVTTWQPRALMRVGNETFDCAWHTTRKLAVGGMRGLYLFDFLTDTPPSTRQ